ncbi:hypothetical protein IPA_09215 [Ignicoccus pacificus DSM 13166]|uniref:THIF-type NAD/FAD binding fold domain-containing protein n=1 Tax=Ignicoccus pacificus DSM 13166 TaxID=940294 RepID=A0A977KC29_9CREN|nr:hypothetical protein IPA_09215 [Ignicoccus pacificus DSM 13166]
MESVARGFQERTSKYMSDMGYDVSDKSVLIGGVGTLGSRILRNLSRFNFKKIYVIDFDVVGPENVGYQCYHSEEVGLKKVECISKRFQKFHPWTNIEGLYLEVPTPSGLWSEESFEKIRSLVKSVDIVVTSFDVLPPRATLLVLAVKYNKFFIDTGLGPTRGYVKVLQEGYCPICGKIWDERVAYYTNPNLAELVASLASQAVIHLLNGVDWPSEVSIYLENPWRPLMVSKVKNDGCRLCSEEVKELETSEEFLRYIIKNAY